MGQYLARKLVTAIPVVLLVSVVVFLLVYLAPGDPVLLMVPIQDFRPESGLSVDQWNEQQIAELRHRFGFDRPLHVQYLDWLWRAVRGDLGKAIRGRQPVLEILLERLPVTLELAFLGLLLATILGIPLGVIAARWRNSPLDNAISTFALSGVSLPQFWLAILLMLAFAVRLGWLPIGGFARLNENPLLNLKLMILPTLSIAPSLMGSIMRMTRSSMLQVLQQDYLTTARAKGLRERMILQRHALKNALIPVATTIGLQLGALLGGAVLVEVIFSIPGLGKITVDSINARDYPVIQGAVLLSSLVFVFINIAVDVLYAFLDPRVRYR
jgi:peptide/nickel transport system permease protein